MASSNTRLPGVKRLMREAKELNEPTSEYYAFPLHDNLFEWHFTIRGPSQTPYEGGMYHGRIIFPTDYPLKPPEIIFLTPNGRFETDKKICLSVSNYHPEQWRPCWGVRTMLLAIIGFFPTPSEGALGSTNISDTEKVRLASLSANWKCSKCEKCNKNLLSEKVDEKSSSLVATEVESLRSQIFITPSSVPLIYSVQEPKETLIKEPSPILTVTDDNPISSNPVPTTITQKNSDSPPLLVHPWSISHAIKFKKSVINKLSASRELTSAENFDSTCELVFPIYDWESSIEKTKEPESQGSNPTVPELESQLIPSTRIKREQAFNPWFHIISCISLAILFYLLYSMGKKVFLIFLNLFDHLLATLV